MFEFDELQVANEFGDMKEVSVQISFKCASPSVPPSGLCGPPEFYDPGCEAEWEIEAIYITTDDPKAKPVELDERQFIAMFPDAQDIVNNAYEWIAEHGEEE